MFAPAPGGSGQFARDDGSPSLTIAARGPLSPPVHLPDAIRPQEPVMTLDTIAPTTRADATRSLPLPQQLAALGTVLCLYRAQQGSELAGWNQAVRAAIQSGVESDGLRESLLFFDRDGVCCWRLCLLPDSDFLAWDQLSARLPAHAAGNPHGRGVSERLWQRLARRLTGEQWRACPVRLHALAAAGAQAVLAASLTPVSALGAAATREIVHAEGAELAAWDDCCCAQAALQSVGVGAAHGDLADYVFRPDLKASR
ncbi:MULTISPECIES: Hemin transport protein [Pseudoxanthomonas]|uniref:Hemin transport protein n=2 Tax=Pseudoxanthomonas winnipegensis TaxID=2480810 RepID=A0AAW8GB89_9GAMM|nr:MULTISPECIES: Hemin transport protein [Pseudoxanthomonas]MDQ1118276.1 hypothetical protein [Pseudoxanthomonas winnipegensis]MDQ1131457.1 hypothetical protein [Pseudoxanthomonas winnipegensis]MDR6138524.1 hypothetical protein [Pseudoxanthomonas sp. SORGH_AS_0997]